MASPRPAPVRTPVPASHIAGTCSKPLSNQHGVMETSLAGDGIALDGLFDDVSAQGGQARRH